MKNLRRTFCVSLSALILSMVLPMTAYGSDSLAYQTQTVSFSGGSRTVHLVWADLNNPGITVLPVTNPGNLTAAAPMRELVERERTADTIELASINGGFFEAYQGSNVIYGILKRDDRYIKTGGSHYVIGINESNQAKLGQPDMTIILEQPRLNKRWTVWGLNHSFYSAEELVIYDSSYGAATPAASGNSIVVRNGKVTEITSGSGPIYSDGFTIASFGRVIDDFEVGESLSFNMETGAEWAGYNTMVSGGPVIVENGALRTDYADQGYTEAKITSQSAQRSFIGITASNKLFVGTVNSVTVAQLGEIAMALGAVDALNLDGGASSALYYGGSYKVSPGRNLASVIVIRDEGGKAAQAVEFSPAPTNAAALRTITAKPIGHQVLVDGQSAGVEMYNIDGYNYFKLRDVAQILSGTEKQFAVGWDQANNLVTITAGQPYTGDTTVTTPGSTAQTAVKATADIAIDGRKQDLEAYEIKGSNYFKLRDLGDILGFTVDFDQEKGAVLIET